LNSSTLKRGIIMKKAIFALGLAVSTQLFAAENLNQALQQKLLEYQQTADFSKREALRTEIQEIQAQINGTSTKRSELSPAAPSAPIGSTGTNSNLYRDTYFYRGPVANNPLSQNSPYLSSPYEGSYGYNTQYSEGRPVYSVNARNPYVNSAPTTSNQPYSNPYTNMNATYPTMQQQAGSQYYPYGYNPMYGPNSIVNQYGYTGGLSQFGWAFNQNPYASPFTYYTGNVQRQDNVSANNQIQYITAYDAKQRFVNELYTNPTQVNAQSLQVQVMSQTLLNDGTYQVVVQTTRGSAGTGAGIGQQRIYIYNQNGGFVRQATQMQTGSNATTTEVQRYDVTQKQIMEIDNYLSSRGYNELGDPLGTTYTSNPLETSQDGYPVTDYRHRINYVLNKFPELAQQMGIALEQ
jgi:hypothetical protein